MYTVYTAYVNREGKIVVDGELGRNTYPAEIGIAAAIALYRNGK